jgi:nickel transport system ATP-binding protein
MSCTTPLLSIDGLQVSLSNQNCPDRHLVNDISLNVVKGKVTGLIGESGSGKSLTCLAVMDLLPQTLRRSNGQISLAGTPLQETCSSLRCFRGKQAAMIMQNPITCFDPIFTIGHHITETLHAHGMEVRRNTDLIRATLADLGFDQPDEILSAYPFQLSGGMLQRIMVSLALLLEAELLIADEPTTDLDVIVQARILDLIDRLRKEKNIGVLLVTHDLSVIARLADEVLVMQEGKVVESGPVSEIFTDPDKDYTRSLLSAHFSLYGKTIGWETTL